MTHDAAALDAQTHDKIVTHLELVTPLLAKTLGSIPLVYVTYPQGFAGAAVYHRWLDQGPATIPTIPVHTVSGTHRYVALSVHNVTWLVKGRFAVELESWSPIATDPQRAAFARIILEPAGTATQADVAAAVLFARAQLQAEGLDGIPILDGGHGFALWIPFNNAPNYDTVARWLHRFVAELAAAHPQLLTTENKIANRGNRVALGIRTNHPGMMSILPYCLRGSTRLPIALPLLWSEVGNVHNGDITVENFPAWLAANGDRFATLSASLAAQNLPTQTKPLQVLAPENAPGSDHVLAAALRVLADGKPRDAESILAAAIAQGWLTADVTRKHLYTDLYEYVTRTLGAGKKPEIIRDEASKLFRLNQPVDAWPDIALPPAPRWLDDTAIELLIERVSAAATGPDPTAFETSVCEAFAALGFAATHIGGNAAPDGTLDAKLGERGYRVILECKTAEPNGIVNNPRPAEPDSFRAAYHGQYALLIGPAFSNEASLKSELQTHQVALWTTDDLARMLRAQVGPLEVLPALAAGIAADACDSILWERAHGVPKRLAYLQAAILTAAWRSQSDFATKLPPSETPALTRDALFLLVDEALIAQGIPNGATRSEYDTAFDQLVSKGSLVPSGSSSYVTPQPYACPG